MTLGLLFAATFAAAVLATGAVLRWLRARDILDRPNHRSSHTVPTPRGGGLALTPLMLAGCAGWFAVEGGGAADWAMLGGAALLGLISWRDDKAPLPPLPRFAAQIAAVAAVLALLPHAGISGGLLPPPLETAVAALAWLWFVNLFNFMDGIDGISGVEAAAIAVGLFVALPDAVAAGPLAVVAGCALGFLVWNWHPAKIFLGDVGSVPLGYVLGYLLLSGAAHHPAGWAAALILPAIYWADATVTIVRRALAGKAIWRAHREHFYQRAVQGGWSHARVSGIVLLGNLGLIGMARLAGFGHPWSGLLGGAAATALVLALFARRHRHPVE